MAEDDPRQDDDGVEEEPLDEDLGERFRGLNYWGYKPTQWQAIVKKDVRLVRHWGCALIVCVGAWFFALRWMGVLSWTAWIFMNCGHPVEILRFVT